MPASEAQRPDPAERGRVVLNSSPLEGSREYTVEEIAWQTAVHNSYHLRAGGPGPAGVGCLAAQGGGRHVVAREGRPPSEATSPGRSGQE